MLGNTILDQRLLSVIKWVIFDVMGVIFTVSDDVNGILIPFLQQVDPAFQPGPAHVRENYVLASAGQMTSEAFWQKIGFGEQYPDIEREFLNTCFTLDPEFKLVARALQETYCLGVLSNDLGEWSQQLRAIYDLNDLFDVVVISGEVGCRKPERLIFEILLERLPANPGECLFVDDKRINLEMGADVGLITTQFVREGQLSKIEPDFTPDYTIHSFSELPALLQSITRQ